MLTAGDCLVNIIVYRYFTFISIYIFANVMKWIGGDYEIAFVRPCVCLSVYTSLGGDMHSYERLVVLWNKLHI